MTVHIYPWEHASGIAEEFKALIEPFCERVLVVGSIRRRRPIVHDVDIVAQSKTVPAGQALLDGRTSQKPLLPDHVRLLVEQQVLEARVKKDGKTMVGDGVAFVSFGGVPVDLYYATERTWGGIVLIRTGSARHNILLTSKAKERGWKLYAGGEGLYDAREGGKRLDDGTEESYFRLLGLAYKEPPEREVP